MTILLAEDNAVNQRVATAMLTKRGHEVDVVGNGVDAVKAVKSRAYDLVLMDIQMPELDGLEATRQIRAWERRHGGHVPIVAMTAHAMKGDREKCLRAGMDEYLSKPVRGPQLFEMIQRVVTHRGRPGATESSKPSNHD